MSIFIFSILFFPIQTDSLVNDTTITPVSIMFQPTKKIILNTYNYNHIQGFFCDFEDKINKNKKINLNIGVGEQ